MIAGIESLQHSGDNTIGNIISKTVVLQKKNITYRSIILIKILYHKGKTRNRISQVLF